MLLRKYLPKKQSEILNKDKDDKIDVLSGLFSPIDILPAEVGRKRDMASEQPYTVKDI